MDIAEVFQDLFTALGLGLLVGLQRQHTETSTAGIRTFALITLLGAVCALLSETMGPWVLAAGLLATAAGMIQGNLSRLRHGQHEPGLTTEFAGVLMFVVGAYTVIGYTPAAVALGGGVAVLLQFKKPLHNLVHGMSEADIRAAMQFVLISMVILPVLPDEAYGPYKVINPRNIWLMVVLIVGISLAGYVAYKLVGQRVGSVLAGVLGGIISSTATTVSYARQTHAVPQTASMSAVVVTIATAVSLARVIVLLAVLAPSTLWQTAPPLAAMLGVGLVVSVAAAIVMPRQSQDMPRLSNPSEMRSAVVFGALYAIVLLAVAAAKDFFGSSGLYVVSGISGLTDMDAITLSTTRLLNDQSVAATVAWRVLLIAAMSNLVFKWVVVAVLGTGALTRRVALLYGVLFVAGVAVLLWWPKGGLLV